MCSGGLEPELAMFLFTYSYMESPQSTYIVGKVFSRRSQLRWNREKRFSIHGEIMRTRWQVWTLGGRSLLTSCLDPLAVREASYSYLGRWRRLFKKGDGSSHSKLVWRHRESQVMIRLHFVSLISPLPPYGFRSNLVPTERSFRGESNAVGCKKFGEELAEDVGYYREMNRLAQIRNISAFLFRLAACWTSPLCVKCSTSIFSCFWPGLEWFGG